MHKYKAMYKNWKTLPAEKRWVMGTFFPDSMDQFLTVNYSQLKSRA